MTGDVPEHMSVSQESTLSECGMRYWLERVRLVPQRPAWWNVGGTAYHVAAEAYERARVLPGSFRLEPQGAREEYIRTLRELAGDLEEVSGIHRREWRVGGRGKEDGTWWTQAGADMFHDYVSAREQDPSTIMVMPDGQLGVEWSFDLDVDGVVVKGVIDQIRRLPDGSIMPVDLKTGARAPETTFQLGTYRYAVDAALAPFSLRCTQAGYFLARKAELRSWYVPELPSWGEISYRYRAGATMKRIGLYQAKPSSLCKACGVRAQCPVKGDGTEYPPLPASARA